MRKFLILFPLFLFAAFIDFSPCLKKYNYIDNSIPITKNLSITFNKSNCFKYDPFTNMCIIKHKNKKVINFFYKPKLAWWMASIKKNEIYIGNFAKENILTPSKLSVKSVKNSIISDMFCRAVGIGRGDGFFKADMIMHFVNTGYWGDVGIDVDRDMKIVSFDPFYVKGIKLNQKILKINGKKANINTYKKYILFAKLNDTVKLNIQGKDFVLKIRKRKYNFTPLEHIGISVNEHLTITNISDKLKKKYLFSSNAKVIKINNHLVNNIKELKKYLSTYKNVTITIKDKWINFKLKLR